MKTITKWQTIIALVAMFIAVIFNWIWIWGILFIFWAIQGIISGSTYLIEPIYKNKNPFLFWMTIISWISIGIYFISILFIDY